MTEDRKVAIQRARDAIDLVRRTREQQGLPPRVEDPAVLDRVARILDSRERREVS